MKLYHADCFDIFPQIEDNYIDLVLCDMPYGTTACKWDTVLDLEKMWKELKRIVRDNTAIVLFSSMPFSAALVSSNYRMFKYEIIWEKTLATGFLNAKRMPLRAHENIQIFYSKQPVYNPQYTQGKPFKAKGGTKGTEVYGKHGNIRSDNPLGLRNPRSVIKINNPNRGGAHPTQKPVAIMEYLIKTYSNEGDTVLDFCMGSGTTGVACKNLKREFIGIEKEEKYFNIAKERVEK